MHRFLFYSIRNRAFIAKSAFIRYCSVRYPPSIWRLLHRAAFFDFGFSGGHTGMLVLLHRPISRFPQSSGCSSRPLPAASCGCHVPESYCLPASGCCPPHDGVQLVGDDNDRLAVHQRVQRADDLQFVVGIYCRTTNTSFTTSTPPSWQRCRRKKPGGRCACPPGQSFLRITGTCFILPFMACRFSAKTISGVRSKNRCLLSSLCRSYSAASQ